MAFQADLLLCFGNLPSVPFLVGNGGFTAAPEGHAFMPSTLFDGGGHKGHPKRSVFLAGVFISILGAKMVPKASKMVPKTLFLVTFLGAGPRHLFLSVFLTVLDPF